MNVLSACKYVHCMCTVLQGPWSLLELKSSVIVSHPVGSVIVSHSMGSVIVSHPSGF